MQFRISSAMNAMLAWRVYVWLFSLMAPVGSFALQTCFRIIVVQNWDIFHFEVLGNLVDHLFSVKSVKTLCVRVTF